MTTAGNPGKNKEHLKMETIIQGMENVAEKREKLAVALNAVGAKSYIAQDEVETESVKLLQSNALSLIEKAELVVIQNDDDYQVASSMIMMAKDGIRKAEELFKPIKRKMDEAKKVVLDQERALVARYEPVKLLLERKTFEYRREQEKRQREESARLAEMARKEAEEAAIQDALAAEAMGQNDVADQIMQAPVYVAPPPPRPAAPKVEGLSFQKNWKGRVVNFDLLPDMYKISNDSAINTVARSLKEKAKIPGVEFYCEETSRSVGRR